MRSLVAKPADGTSPPPDAKPRALAAIFFKMRLLFVILLSLIWPKLSGQSFQANVCDSLLLTKSEFEKCKKDSLWTNDIIEKTNYISNLKTQVLPKLKRVRQKLILSDSLQKAAKILKETYDSVVVTKIHGITSVMDGNQLEVQPKAYISSLLSLQLFNFYPDVYAVLLNELHLSLLPKTNPKEHARYLAMVNDIRQLISDSLRKEILIALGDFTNWKNNLSFSPYLFQGDLPSDLRNDYEIISFLLWTQ